MAKNSNGGLPACVHCGGMLVLCPEYDDAAADEGLRRGLLSRVWGTVCQLCMTYGPTICQESERVHDPGSTLDATVVRIVRAKAVLASMQDMQWVPGAVHIPGTGSGAQLQELAELFRAELLRIVQERAAAAGDAYHPGYLLQFITDLHIQARPDIDQVQLYADVSGDQLS